MLYAAVWNTEIPELHLKNLFGWTNETAASKVLCLPGKILLCVGVVATAPGSLNLTAPPVAC
jgi:hypothetical protein